MINGRDHPTFVFAMFIRYFMLGWQDLFYFDTYFESCMAFGHRTGIRAARILQALIGHVWQPNLASGAAALDSSE